MRRKIWCDVWKRKYFGLGWKVNAALLDQSDTTIKVVWWMQFTQNRQQHWYQSLNSPKIQTARFPRCIVVVKLISFSKRDRPATTVPERLLWLIKPKAYWQKQLYTRKASPFIIHWHCFFSWLSKFQLTNTTLIKDKSIPVDSLQQNQKANPAETSFQFLPGWFLLQHSSRSHGRLQNLNQL
jgi:hypothetical protein